MDDATCECRHTDFSVVGVGCAMILINATLRYIKVNEDMGENGVVWSGIRVGIVGHHRALLR